VKKPFARTGLSASDIDLIELKEAFAAAAEQGRYTKVSAAIRIIEHPALKPRRIPSRSWRELLKKVCEVDPLLCPSVQYEMRIVSLINDAQIIVRPLVTLEKQILINLGRSALPVRHFVLPHRHRIDEGEERIGRHRRTNIKLHSTVFTNEPYPERWR